MDDVTIYRDLIARYAATLVEDGDTIFINTSRNALNIIKYAEYFCKKGLYGLCRHQRGDRHVHGDRK